jgi:transposase
MEHTTIAVDLAKSVFQIAVSHQPGRVDEERRLSRDRFLEFFAQRPPATVLLEACGSAHYWARQLQPFGHSVRLLAPHDVRPYVRRNKTDRTDAKGLLEANRNEEIHPVPVKSIAHQAIASLHCLRSTWLATRTARLNTIRGLLLEFGVFIPVGAHHVVPRVRALLAEATAVPPLLDTTLTAACDEIDRLEANMYTVERQLARLGSDMADVTLLQTVPGVGLITATALIALVTDMCHQQTRRRLFADARHPWRPIPPVARQERETADVAAALGGADRAAARAQRGDGRRRQQARADRMGRLGARPSVRSRSPRRVTAARFSLPGNCTECSASWRTGRTGAGPRR